MPPEDRLIVTQHHKLLKARQELTTIQKRVFSLGTAIMRNSDTLLPRIHIPVPYYQRIYGGSTSLYRNLAKNMRDLLDAKVFIEEEPGAMEFVGYPLVSMAAYLGQRSSPTKIATCSFAFNPELAPYLVGLTGHFQSYKLERTRNLSARSDRLFEVLLAETWGFRPDRSEVYFSLDQLQQYLNCLGYQWRDIRRDFILRAQEEHRKPPTDLVWDFETHLVGGRVVGVHFYIRAAVPANPFRDAEAEGVDQAHIDVLTLQNEFRAIGFNQNVDPFVDKLGYEHVRDILRTCRRIKDERDRDPKGRPIENLPAFIHSELKKAVEGKLTVLSPGLFDNTVTVEPTATTTSDEESAKRAVESAANGLLAELSEERLNVAGRLYDQADAELHARVRKQIETDNKWLADHYGKAKWEKETVLRIWASTLNRLEPEAFPAHLRTVSAYVDETNAFEDLADDLRAQAVEHAISQDPWRTE